MRRRGYATVNCCGEGEVYDSSCKLLSDYLWIFENATFRNVEDIFTILFCLVPTFLTFHQNPQMSMYIRVRNLLSNTPH
jgi:hypothetical protein